MNQLCRCSLAIQLFVAAYLCTMYRVLPGPKYYPTHHLWTFGSIEGETIAMNWYGYAAMGLLAAAVGYLAGAPYAKLQEWLKFDLAGSSACVAGLAFMICVIAHEAHRWFQG